MKVVNIAFGAEMKPYAMKREESEWRSVVIIRAKRYILPRTIRVSAEITRDDWLLFASS